MPDTSPRIEAQRRRWMKGHPRMAWIYWTRSSTTPESPLTLDTSTV